jgi:putative PIN family toxin of toxin-antitoxin system
VKVVIDTNVLMSGIFFGGTPGRIVDAVKLGEITLAASPSILDEYRRVGEDLESNYGELGAPSMLTFLAARAEVVDAPDLATPASRDPDDDKFLACALAASASVIVSGDRDLQTLESWQGIDILSPRAFADKYLSRGGT